MTYKKDCKKIEYVACEVRRTVGKKPSQVKVKVVGGGGGD
jgi:hypothetical protein